MTAMDANEQHRKLFIGGLSYKTTKETLHVYYEQWGELVDSVVMQDKMTAKSRGFGFVTYRNGDALEKAMSERPHEIDGKRVDPKRAIPKEMGKDSGKNDLPYMSVRKIFVGGIRDKPITEDDLKKYFSRYGDIKDCVIMTDKTTQKSRGFAFVVFDDYDSVDKIIIHRYHIINGINVEVKKAVPKEDPITMSRTGPAPMVYHSRGLAPYPYQGYGHGGWGTGGYAGAPILSASAPNVYGFPGYPPATSAPPFGGYNPRDLPTYGGINQSNPRVGNLGTPNPYPASAMTNAVSYNPGSGFGSNVYATDRR